MPHGLPGAGPKAKNMNTDSLKPVTLLCHVPPSAAIRGRGRAGTAALPLHPECLTTLGDGGREALATFATVASPDGSLALPDPADPGLTRTTPVVVVDGDTTSPGLARAITGRLVAVMEAVDAAVRDTVAAGQGFGIPALDVTLTDRRIDYHRETWHHFDGYPAVPAHTRAALRFGGAQLRAAIAARIDAAIAETDARVTALVSGVTLTPDDAEGWCVDPGLASRCPAAAAFEQRIVAVRIEHREAVAEALRVQRERREADQAARDAAWRDRCAAFREVVRAFALTLPDAAPGAEDGYDMAPAVADTIAARVEAIVSTLPGVVGTTVLRDGTKAYEATDIPEARKAPSARSVKARRAADADLNVIRATLPTGLALDVSPVGRVIDYEATDDGGTWARRTGFVVYIHGVDGLPFPGRLVVAWCEAPTA